MVQNVCDWLSEDSLDNSKRKLERKEGEFMWEFWAFLEQQNGSLRKVRAEKKLFTSECPN
jgi:hypothetical protein